jgi:hypothetical protein
LYSLHFRALLLFIISENIIMAAPEVAVDSGAGWDEAQCASALAQLEQLQAQVQI